MSNGLSRVIIIAASPRTGSNLLCRGLAVSGLVGNPYEYLASTVEAMERGELPWRALSARGVASRIRRRLRADTNWRRASPAHVRRRAIATVLRRSAAEHVGPNGTYAIKLMWGHLGRIMLGAGVDADVWGAPVTWIHLRRDDTVAQAVSWWRAIQSRQWMGGHATEPPIVFDRERILALEAQARSEEAEWQRFFAERRLEPIEVVYEDLSVAYESTMRTVLDALGHPEIVVPSRQTLRQSDDVSNEWIRRVKATGAP